MSANKESASQDVHLDTIFEWCSDVRAVRDFYGGLVGVEETHFDQERGWLTYQFGATQVVYLQTPNPPHQFHGWAEAFHLTGEKVQSWVMRLEPTRFQVVSEKIREAGYETKAPEDGQPMLFVQDPTGRTIEFWGQDDVAAN